MPNDYDEIFESYYQLFRGEATVPDSTDDEYIMGMTFANKALGRWANYDATYWKELWDTNQNDETGSQTIVTSDTTYSAPANFREAGGKVQVKDSNGKIVQEYPIVDPQERQFLGEDATYCYFTKNNLYYDTGTASQSGTTITGVGTAFTSAMVGKQIRFDSGETATIIAYTSATVLTASVSQTVASSAFKITGSGFVLNINPAPSSTLNGLDIEYAYYKNPTKYTAGASVSEIPNTWFVVHDMLAQRYQIERNYGGYQIAKRDAEELLKNLQQDNNSGSWGNPWVVPDRTGSAFGV